jgi:cytochrome c-type biogenesis protein CcmH/NrfG
MFLLDDLLLMPVDGMKFIFRTLAKVAEEQYTDDAPVKQQLLELQVQLDNGDITEEQYVREEARILRELREIENRRREMAGLPPEREGPLSGKVSEGSSASVHLGYGETRKR